MGVDVVTFGCRLNAAESEVIRREAERAGYRDTIVVNTCAVTAEAVRQARQRIRALRRERPQAKIVVTGCAAQTEPQTFAAMAEADQVLGNAEKLDGAAWLRARAALSLDDAPKAIVNDIMAVKETAAHLVDTFEGRARAFVQVQNGCDHRCTFCIIPYGRGNSRSVPMGAVVEDVRRLVANGYREIVLTGVDITAYGADLPGTPRLGRLVKQILKHVPELEQLRLSSIDSVEADNELLDAIASDARLMPHLHLSLQSGDDLILKRMKRRHSRADTIAFCDTVRRLRPDVAFGADLIAGFPDRDRGDVRQLTRSDRSLRPDASARLSVFAAAGHAGGADAAASAQRRQGSGAALARAWRAGVAGASRCRSRHDASRPDRVGSCRPHRAVCAGPFIGAGRTGTNPEPEINRA